MAIEPHYVEGLGAAVRARMDELGLDATALQRITGKSAGPIRRLRRGESRGYDQATKLAVCAALRWTPDSIDRLLNGLPAVVLDDAAVEQPPPRPTRTAAVLDATTLAEIAASVAARNAAAIEGLQARIEDVMSEVQGTRRDLLDRVDALRHEVLGLERPTPVAEQVFDTAP